MDDYTDEGEGTPSQQALDAQERQKAMVEQAGFLGRIALARTQVSEAVAEGADATKGRELLGQLDDMAEFPNAGGDNAEVYKEFKAFIRGGAAPSGQGATPVAPSGQAPPPSAAKKAVNLNKARADYAAGKTNEYPG